MKKIFMVVFSASLLAGCASQSLTTSKFQDAHLYNYTFSKDDIGDSKINAAELSIAVKNSILNNTRYGFRQSWVGEFYRFSGLYIINKPNNTFSVVYGAGDNMSRSQNDYDKSKYQVKTEFDIIPTVGQTLENGTLATVSVGEDIRVTNGTNAIGINEFKHPSTIQTYSQEITSALGKKNVAILRRTNIEGEIDLPYNTDSIYANFLRKLGYFNGADNTKSNDIDKRKVYAYKTNGQSVELFVRVLPYRNGSKVNYSINLPYYLYGDGSVSLNKAGIQDVKRGIEKIAND